MNRSAVGTELRTRLPEREELSLPELRRRFWPDASAADLSSLGDLIREELSIPIGLLRPEDSMRALLAPMSFRNPLRWYLVEPRLEDGISELNYELCKRLPPRHRHGQAHVKFETWTDVVVAWCGLLPVPADEPAPAPDNAG
jgi:hypothetical protein